MSIPSTQGDVPPLTQEVGSLGALGEAAPLVIAPHLLIQNSGKLFIHKDGEICMYRGSIGLLVIPDLAVMKEEIQTLLAPLSKLTAVPWNFPAKEVDR
jgi:hypothetical protein